MTYNKINLRSVDRSSFLQERINQTENPYTFFVHTLDSVGDPLALFQAIKPNIKDSIIYASYFVPDSLSTKLVYYEQLKNSCEECRTSTPATVSYNSINQVHLTIIDWDGSKSFQTKGIHENEIVGLEEIDDSIYTSSGAVVGILIAIFVGVVIIVINSISKIKTN